MRKKLLSLALALVLCVGLAAPAFAAEISDTAGVNLTGGERKIYDAMKDAVLEIVAGKRTSTEISLTFEAGEFGWTAGELGLTRIGSADGTDYINPKLDESLRRIYTSLEYNYPFDLFFTQNGGYHSNYRWTNRTSQAWLTKLTVSLMVTPAYQGGDDKTVDPAKIAQAVSTRATAQSIVRANEGKSNYEKLEAYRQAICDLTDYNYEIYDTWKTDTYVYGNPSQAVYVFDNDPNTKVLCEGYAKAFKYLCDLSEFVGDVHCYLVEGDLNGEDHMWNMVRMEDGNYYLTDVTAYDTGGYAPLLALSSEDPANYNYQEMRYTYRDNQYGVYTNGYLPISGTPYRPTVASRFSDVKVSDYYADAVLWAVENNITSGTGKNTFSPEMTCNRAQILSFLWRAAGSPAPAVSNPFTDVTAADYYYEAALWACECGMVTGPVFGASTPCTRASTVEYMWKATGSPAAAYDGTFSDVPADAAYAQAVAWALANGVTAGTGETTFGPDDTCTRGQIATFLYRGMGE